jgi:hypothetical protein
MLAISLSWFNAVRTQTPAKLYPHDFCLTLGPSPFSDAPVIELSRLSYRGQIFSDRCVMYGKHLSDAQFMFQYFRYILDGRISVVLTIYRDLPH